MGDPPPGGRAPGGECLPRSSRIRRGTDIRVLLREGRKAKGAYLEVFVRPASGAFPRFGAVVPRYGRSVVERNLVRRRLREIGRREVLPRLREGALPLDVLVRTRPRAYAASFPDLRDELTRLTERLCSDAS